MHPVLLTMRLAGQPDNSNLPALIIGAVVVVLIYKALTRTPESELRRNYELEPGKTIKKLVEQWPVEHSESESIYEKQLAGFLKDKLGKIAKVRRQQGAGSTRCDIQIDKKVALELKVKLDSTSKVQRLIGQIEMYKRESEADLIVVLIGESRDDLEDTVREHVKGSRNVHLVIKQAAAAASA